MAIAHRHGGTERFLSDTSEARRRNSLSPTVMAVQVFGNAAVVHGSVTEKRIRDGKDTSREFVWMNLLEKRAGKWVVVRSAGTSPPRRRRQSIPFDLPDPGDVLQAVGAIAHCTACFCRVDYR
jgi:hypothetical protein